MKTYADNSFIEIDVDVLSYEQSINILAAGYPIRYLEVDYLWIGVDYNASLCRKSMFTLHQLENLHWCIAPYACDVVAWKLRKAAESC